MEVIPALTCAVALLATATAAEAGPGDPPAHFAKALDKLDGYRLDSRDKGWTTRPMCDSKSDRLRTACVLLKKSWQVRTVKTGTSGRDAVVQSLWLLRYEAPTQAEQALRSFAGDFNDGPFAKHPFTMHLCGAYIVAVESRFRFPAWQKELARTTRAALGKRCTKTIRSR